MSVEYFGIPVIDQKDDTIRRLKARFSYDEMRCDQPLVIMAMGLGSYYLKAPKAGQDGLSHPEIAQLMNKQGFATLQFNYMGHGYDGDGKDTKHKSDGDFNDVTISTGVQDILAVWNYTKQNLRKKADTNDICINANSYGAFCTLRAIETDPTFRPTAAALLGPFDVKSWMPYLRMFAKRAPKTFDRLFQPILSLTHKNVEDFYLNHMDALQKYPGVIQGKLPAIRFFLGTNDFISSTEKYSQLANSFPQNDAYYPDGKQADCKTAKCEHFHVPTNLQLEINREICNFFRKAVNAQRLLRMYEINGVSRLYENNQHD